MVGSKEEEEKQTVSKADLDSVGITSDIWAFNAYHLFKKAHRMVSW